MRNYRVDEEAERDLLGIWVHIASDNPSAADRTLKRFHRTFSWLAKHTGMGQSCESLGPNLRMVSEGNYVIFFRATPDGIAILRVLQAIPAPCRTGNQLGKRPSK